VEFQKILYRKEGRIAYITINRPERLNAIDAYTSGEMLEAFTDFKEDDDLWVAILTGAGDRAFSTGNDLVATAQRSTGQPENAPPPRPAAFGGITRNFECYKPIIAAINGYCLAGGMEIALACDIRIASETAQFGLPEPTRAIIPGAGGTQRLPRMIPMAFAMKVLLTGARIDAQEALRAGIVSDVVPQEQLMAKAREVAEQICDCGPLAVRAVKEAVLRGLQVPLNEGLQIETELSRLINRTEDAREGPLAFAEKRKPNYKGR
jgi:enoyl-CoA hydratase/carnithine racemase